MIFRLAKNIVFGIIKKVLTFILLIVIIVWVLFFRDSEITRDVSDFFKNIFSTQVEVEYQPVKKGESFNASTEVKAQIDAWIRANGYNEYGDPQGTMYIGGTPLFNEQTGETIDRYDYILHQHPELRSLLK